MQDGPNSIELPEVSHDLSDLAHLAVSRTDRAVLISDASRKLCFANPAFTTMFGYAIEEVGDLCPWELLAGPKTDIRLHERALNGNRDRASLQDELLLRTKAGDPIWVSARIDAVYTEDGKLSRLVAMLTDITNSKRVQLLQREVLEGLVRDEPLTELMQHVCSQVELLAPDIVCSILRVDRDGTMRPLAAPSLPDYVSAAIDGTAIGPEVGTCGTAAWRGEPVLTLDIDSDPAWEGFKSLILPLGLRACWSIPMTMRDGKVAGTFAFYFADNRGPSAWHEKLVETCAQLCGMAIERDETKRRINQLAYFDAVTGLQNRASLRRHLGEKLGADKARVRRDAFLCVDIDRFKDINDTFGVPVGDGVLAAVGRRLAEIVTEPDEICRLSGDAFIVALADAGPRRASQMAQRIIDALLAPVEIAGVTLPISSSIGIALYPSDAEDVDGLLRHCETAMYEAKQQGRGSFQFFVSEMQALNKERLVLGTALREAIALDQLELVYQPQIDCVSGKVYGAEALARWTHPEFGPISPARFIPIAEQIGVIEAIGDWALRTACAQLRAWRSLGLDVPAVSVNFSPQQFRNPKLAATISACLAANRLCADDLTVEITEGLMLEETPAVVANIEALAGMGIRLSMDDFGTGHSSLSLLARLPVTELKIDRSFMDRIEDDSTAQAVVTAVVCIGQSLDMTLVAEGVENDAQRRFLIALGCAVHQGYHYAKPMSHADFAAWMTLHDGGELKRKIA